MYEYFNILFVNKYKTYYMHLIYINILLIQLQIMGGINYMPAFNQGPHWKFNIVIDQNF